MLRFGIFNFFGNSVQCRYSGLIRRRCAQFVAILRGSHLVAKIPKVLGSDSSREQGLAHLGERTKPTEHPKSLDVLLRHVVDFVGC